MPVRSLSVRSLSAAALLGLVGLAPSLSPALAEPATHQLAGKDTVERLAKVERGFAQRTARVSAIMAPERYAAPLRIPTRPSWTRAPRREAAALVR